MCIRDSLDSETLTFTGGTGIDTSGSISDIEINKFMSEINGIINSYPNLKCKLWYADSECYGPYNIDSLDSIPKPKGGGGTDFEPFFEEIEKEKYKENDGVCIYLTLFLH